MFDFLYRLDQNNYIPTTIFIIWDCDAKVDYQKCNNDYNKKRGNVIPYIMKKNKENTIVKTGIENLFSETILKASKSLTDEENLIYLRDNDKKILQNYILKNALVKDFNKFEDLFTFINN